MFEFLNFVGEGHQRKLNHGENFPIYGNNYYKVNCNLYNYTCKYMYMKPEVKLILGHSVPEQNIGENDTKTVFNMYSIYSKNLVTAKLTVAEIQPLETTSLPFPISGFSKKRSYNRL